MATTLTIKQKSYYATIDEWNRIAEISPSPAHGMIDQDAVVDYLGHVSGGMVKARHNGETIILHPGCTVELSD